MNFGFYGKVLTSLLWLVLSYPEAYAASKWVTDILYVPVRSGASVNHRILKNLKSGTKVEIVEAPPASEYVKIKVFDREEIEGWVLSRYLIDEPIAKFKLERLEREIAQSDQSQQPLRDTLEVIKQQLNDVQNQKLSLTSENEHLKAELAEIRRISSEKIDTFELIKQLRADQSVLQSQLEEMKQKNVLLEHDRRNEGIKLGLIAVALGGFAGLMLPLLKSKKKQGHPIRLR